MNHTTIAELTAALEKPFWRIGLPAALEGRFEAGTVAHRNRCLAGWLLLALGFNLFFLFLDLASGDQLGSPVTLMHIGLILLVTVAAASISLQPSVWLVSLLIVGTHLADLAAGAWIGLQVPEPFADRIITTTGFMILVVNVTSPLRFRDCVALSTMSVLAYAALLLGPMDKLPVPQWDNILVASVMALISVGIVHGRERAARRAFVFGEVDRLRLRDMVVMSETDVLTSLPNRRAFDGALETQWELSRESGALLGLLLIDIDHFKLLNDTNGHAEGDRCLRAVAGLMRSVLRPDQDLIARYGGEEFAVVLRNADPVAMLEVARRVREQVERAALPHPVHGVVTVSVGAALAQPSAGQTEPGVLVAFADKALYEAKMAGRNRVAMADQAA